MNSAIGVARALLLAMLVLGVAPCANAAAGWRVVASKQRYALYAQLDVSANVSRPTAIALRVISHPAQETVVKWAVVCSSEGRSGSTTGSYKPQTTNLQTLRLPTRSPRSCKVVAHGRMPNGGGTLVMKIYGRS